MTDARNHDHVALYDQAKAELVGIAPMFGIYFRALLAGGCDEDLARALVSDLHFARVVNPPVPEEEDAEGGTVSDDDVLYDTSYHHSEVEQPIAPFHRGRDADGCPVCGVLASEPCVIRGRG